MAEKRVTIIASCHVFDLKEKMTSIIEEIKPECVCLELDEGRFERLKSGDVQESPLSNLQRDIAGIYGAKPGNDMLGAVIGAESVKAEIMLIDEEIEKVMEKIKKALSSIAISQLFGSILSDKDESKKSDLVEKVMGAHDIHSLVELLVQSFEEDPDSYREMLSQHFPQLTKILLDEREEFMFRGLEYALSKHDRAVAVVGAGHVNALKKRLESIGVDVDTVPVSDVRRWGMKKIGVS